MADIYLSICRCGGEGEFLTEPGERIFAQCRLCKIRTPSRGARLEVAAKQEVADIWNCGSELWLRWVKPVVAEDAYAAGARVSHSTGTDGALEHWISHRENNVWEPGVSGWTLAGPAPVK